MKKKLGIALAVVAVLLLTTVAGYSLKAKGARAVGQGPVMVQKATAQVGKLSGGTAVSGKLEALHAANVVPKMSGKIASIPVDVGSEVAQGDLLASLEATDLAALVDLYAAQLDKARNSDLPAQKNQLELTLANTEAAFKTAQADYERNKQLWETSVVSAQQYEQSEKQYLQARAAYEAAQKSLEILNQATIPDTIRQYEAQLKKAQADFANSLILAPIGGVVTARNANPGEMASPTQPLVSLANLDTVLVQANVQEGQVNQLKVGQELLVKVSSARDEPFTGKVTNIALAANSSTKAFPVKVQIENPGHALKPGMFAEVFLHNQDQEGILIPREAVSQSGDKKVVWVIANGRVAQREVVTGPADAKKVLVSSGLEQGEEVAVTGADLLLDGMEVGILN